MCYANCPNRRSLSCIAEISNPSVNILGFWNEDISKMYSRVRQTILATTRDSPLPSFLDHMKCHSFPVFVFANASFEKRGLPVEGYLQNLGGGGGGGGGMRQNRTDINFIK